MLSGVLATTGPGPRDFDTGGGPEKRYVECVSGDYFGVLGVQTLLGRALTPDDGPAAPVAVLSYAYWQRAYGGSPAVLGRTIRIQKAPFTIAGVAPPQFFGVHVGRAPDAWIPLSAFPMVFRGTPPFDPHFIFLNLIGRLRPGVTPEKAAAALTPLTIQMTLENLPPRAPESLRREVEGMALKFSSAAKGMSSLRRRFSEPLRVVFAMVAIGLLLACINVMSLQFARADQRRKELTVRLAIGAGAAASFANS